MNAGEIQLLVRKELDRLEVPSNLKGYRLIPDAVFFLITKEVEGEGNNIKMKDVYEAIKKRHKTTYQKAERNMRYVLEDAERREVIGKNKVTLSGFLYGLSYEVQEKVQLFVEQENLSNDM